MLETIHQMERITRTSRDAIVELTVVPVHANAVVTTIAIWLTTYLELIQATTLMRAADDIIAA